MLIANVYGRLGNDPVARTTKDGKAMATCSMAVDITPHNAEEQETLWVSVLTFGQVAETLLRAEKGQMVAAIGRMTKGQYTAKTGEIKEQWTLLAESVITAKTARPQGNARRPASA